MISFIFQTSLIMRNGTTTNDMNPRKTSLQWWGKAYRLPRLFTETQHIFEKPWIYYGERCDLIGSDRETIYNKSDDLVCMKGQAEGLEGLRQKGWCLNNLPMIEKVTKRRNTLGKTLRAGGWPDNHNSLSKYFSNEALDEELQLIPSGIIGIDFLSHTL